MRKFNSIIFPSTGGIATILNPGITPTAGSYIDEYVSLLSVLEIGDSSGYLKYFQVAVPAWNTTVFGALQIRQIL